MMLHRHFEKLAEERNKKQETKDDGRHEPAPETEKAQEPVKRGRRRRTETE